ncbi:hypothetical protein LDENG_00191240 [Lucifuga dentata]|nr:hypothetical protein LDENG_00191240 [Lucifuga dentata]
MTSSVILLMFYNDYRRAAKANLSYCLQAKILHHLLFLLLLKVKLYCFYFTLIHVYSCRYSL